MAIPLAAILALLIIVAIVVIGALFAAGFFKSGAVTTAKATTPPTVATTTGTPQTTSTTSTTSTATSTSTTTAAAASGSLGPWQNTTAYPLENVSGIACAEANGYVYCIGGFNWSASGAFLKNVEYAKLTSTGIGPWHPTSPYPSGVAVAACVANTTTVACTGGEPAYSTTGSRFNNVAAAAHINANGSLGAWTVWPSLPLSEAYSNCVAGENFYCVGGLGVSGNTNSVILFNSSGAAALPTAYPDNVTYNNCMANSTSGGIILCTDGLAYNSSGIPHNYSYYGFDSRNGVTSWKQTTRFPRPVEEGLVNCAMASNNNVYCVTQGANVSNMSVTVYAHLTGNGLGSWYNTTRYPLIPNGAYASPQSCVAYGGDFYCIGWASSVDSTQGPQSFYAAINP